MSFKLFRAIIVLVIHCFICIVACLWPCHVASSLPILALSRFNFLVGNRYVRNRNVLATKSRCAFSRYLSLRTHHDAVFGASHCLVYVGSISKVCVDTCFHRVVFDKDLGLLERFSS